MKRLLAIVASLACSLMALEPVENPLSGGDPFILLNGDTYYAYATNHRDGFLVYESTDLKSWRLCDNGRNGFALHKDDIPSAKKWFWAPEVYADPKGGFVMYFTHDVQISCARSSSPTGPFLEVGGKPMYDNAGGDNRIDNTLFVDDDGKPYLFFCRFQKDVTKGSEIWVGELEADHVTLCPRPPVFCLRAEAPWERIRGAVSEGPFVIKHQGKYYLTYSANDYQSPDYAIGYAVADSPLGPYKKAEENPILRRPAGFLGAGHHTIFRDREGRLRIVFHVHRSATQIHVRRILIGTVFFDEKGRLKIGDEFIQPVVVPQEKR